MRLHPCGRAWTSATYNRISRFFANPASVAGFLLMKAGRRKLLRFAAALFLLLGLLVALCLAPVDYTPYLSQPYFVRTAERLEVLTAGEDVVRGELRAGFGEARLTPTIGAEGDDAKEGLFRAIPLSGYGQRKGQPATGTHDDLFVKTVALEVGNEMVIVFGIDALIVPREVADGAAAQLKEELGLRREQLYFSATHTHCGIGGWAEGVVGEAFAGEFNPAARAWFVRQVVTAAREAVADLVPAALSHGEFEAPEFIRNRLVGEVGRVNAAFTYLVVEQERGGKAVIGSYGAHATVLPASVYEFSGDYPGYWQRAVEEATGAMAMFLAGSVGSHGPVAGGKGFQGAERMGKALAQEFLDRMQKEELTNRIAFGLHGLEVDLPELHMRLTSGVRLRPWLAEQFLPVSTNSFLQAVRLADSVWISTPCDFSGELALELRDLLAARNLQATVTSFNGDYIGYVIPLKYYHLGGYEPQVMSFFGPNVPEYLMHLIRELALDLAEQPASAGLPQNQRAKAVNPPKVP